jgi:hypothetical protein
MWQNERMPKWFPFVCPGCGRYLRLRLPENPCPRCQETLDRWLVKWSCFGLVWLCFVLAGVMLIAFLRYWK